MEKCEAREQEELGFIEAERETKFAFGKKLYDLNDAFAGLADHVERC